MKFLTISFGLMMISFTVNAQQIQTLLGSKSGKKIDSLLKLKNIGRTFDGTGNNLENQKWGAINSDLIRLCEPNYADGKSKMWQQKPNVRAVNTMIGQVDNDKIPKDKNGVSALFPIYGQFLDHDITQTASAPSGKQQSVPIKVPQCDLFFDPQCKGNIQLPFTRSLYNPNKEIRTNINAISAWIDASQVYGSTKQKADSLRTFCDGKLQTSQGNMPVKDKNGFYIAGDPRANQNIGLSSIHIVFLREHNRLCDEIVKKYPKLDDQQIYQTARHYVIGLIQHITFDQYLPLLLGKKNFDKLIGEYKGYDCKTNPDIITEFSSAGYRLHSLVYFPFVFMKDDGKIIYTLKQSEMLSNPNLIKPQTLKLIFNGLITSPMKQRSLEMISQLRNGLVLTPDRNLKFDLYSLNIQRGRDHGVCSIPDLRKVLCLQNKKSFCQIFESHSKAHKLQKLYQQLKNVDLYLAILGQKLIKGAVLGEIGIGINAMQFSRLRNGDRLWYENVYPEEIVKEIKKTTFTDVLRRNDCLKNQWQLAFKKA